MIQEGKKAPALKLQNQDGKTVQLKDFTGKKIVLYFYPKDMTSGCTQEACDFRDSLPALQAINAVVLGVSPDTVALHKKFTEKYSLNFDLLSDPGKEILEKYGVWKEKSMYGRKYMGVERTTVVIDEAGKIIKIFAKVKVAGHVKEVNSVLAG
ncbi:MAG: thioredoxin-dependent thiol peroxidase [Ignavibacteriales bacterium]|nr:thioredoxin-dependent thiol peroxidase [Ignavibacteriales bacterium]